ncbi:MAG: hypothetical protein AB1640_07305 [bacterium]
MEASETPTFEFATTAMDRLGLDLVGFCLFCEQHQLPLYQLPPRPHGADVRQSPSGGTRGKAASDLDRELQWSLECARQKLFLRFDGPNFIYIGFKPGVGRPGPGEIVQDSMEVYPGKWWWMRKPEYWFSKKLMVNPADVERIKAERGRNRPARQGPTHREKAFAFAKELWAKHDWIWQVHIARLFLSTNRDCKRTVGAVGKWISKAHPDQDRKRTTRPSDNARNDYFPKLLEALNAYKDEGYHFAFGSVADLRQTVDPPKRTS